VRYSSAGNEASAVSLEAKKRSLNAVARVPDSSNVREEVARYLLATFSVRECIQESALGKEEAVTPVQDRSPLGAGFERPGMARASHAPG